MTLGHGTLIPEYMEKDMFLHLVEKGELTVTWLTASAAVATDQLGKAWFAYVHDTVSDSQ